MGSDDVTADEIARLVGVAQRGNRAAFEEIVRLTYSETYTLALRLTNNSDDASDVTQDTYMRAYRSLDKFRSDAKFTTWLYRITANCASTQLTKRRKHRHEDFDDAMNLLVDSSPGPEAHADAAFDQARLTQVLAGLPDGLRAVVVLRDIYDLPHDAIARELGISEVTAKVRLHRARKKLRDRLTARLEEESNARVV